MDKSAAYDILKDAFNEFINNAAQDFAGSYDALSVKVSGTFVESGNALDGPLPDLPE